MPAQETGAPPRRYIVIAAVIALALAVVIAVLSLMNRSQPEPSPDNGPLGLVPVSAPQANSPECAALIPALPAQLLSNGATLNRRVIAEPAPPATVAWGAPDAIVLRCGLDRPAELTPTSELRVVSGVQWLVVEGQGASSWYVVDRNVYVALTVPDSSGTGPLQTISDTVAKTLKPMPLRF